MYTECLDAARGDKRQNNNNAHSSAANENRDDECFMRYEYLCHFLCYGHWGFADASLVYLLRIFLCQRVSNLIVKIVNVRNGHFSVIGLVHENTHSYAQKNAYFITYK